MDSYGQFFNYPDLIQYMHGELAMKGIKNNHGNARHFGSQYGYPLANPVCAEQNGTGL